MRKFSETTARNLLRRPLVLGVPPLSLAILSLGTVLVSMILGTSQYGNLVSLGIGVGGYLVLRVLTRIAKNGWEEGLLWKVERRLRNKNPDGTLESNSSTLEIISPDTLDENGLIQAKESLKGQLLALKPNESLTLHFRQRSDGTSFEEIRASGSFDYSNIDTIRMLIEGALWDE